MEESLSWIPGSPKTMEMPVCGWWHLNPTGPQVCLHCQMPSQGFQLWDHLPKIGFQGLQAGQTGLPATSWQLASRKLCHFLPACPYLGIIYQESPTWNHTAISEMLIKLRGLDEQHLGWALLELPETLFAPRVCCWLMSKSKWRNILVIEHSKKVGKQNGNPHGMLLWLRLWPYKRWS